MSYFFFFASVFCLIGCAISAQENKTRVAWAYGVISIMVTGVGVFLSAPEDFGMDYVRPEVKEFKTRLDKGVAYEVLSETPVEGGDRILLFKRGDAWQFRSPFIAMRVKKETVVPKHFTLIDGKPVAIVPATPPSTK